MADYPITAVDRRVVYSGSAGTGPYNFSFPVLTATDINVYKDTTKLTLTTDYSVTISASDGTGSVTLVSPASGDNTVTIVGARAIQRTTDFVTAGDLLASSLNVELDSQTIFVQQVSEDADRAIKAPVTDPTSIDMTLPVKATRATKALGFDSAGDPVVSTLTLAQIEAGSTDAAASATAAANSATAASSSETASANSATASAASAATASAYAGTQTVDLFNGTGSQTAFTLSVAPANGDENNTDVHISGVYQQKDTYSLSGTTLTFSTAPPSGTGNVEVMHMSARAIETPADGSVTYPKFASGLVDIDLTAVSAADDTIASAKAIKTYVDAQVDTVDTLAEVLAIGNTTGGTDLGVSTGDDITFADSSKAIFGAGSDLQIYHDGTNSFITDAGTGLLHISGDSSVHITNAAVDENKATFETNGAVTLYYDNAYKFATTATGVDITGTIVGDGLTLTTGATVTTVLDEDNMASNSATALSTQQSIKAYVDAQVDTVDTLAETLAIGNTTGGTDIGVSAGDDITFTDSSKAIFGAGGDLQIFHDGTSSFINESGSGGLRVGTSQLQVQNAAFTENMILATADGAVTLYHDSAAKLATAATGVAITGEVTATGFTGTLDGILGSGTAAAATVTTLTTSGNVGIKTSAPENPMTIQDIAGSTFNRDFSIRNGDATNYHRLILGYNAGSVASGVPANAQFLLAEKGGGYGTSGGLVVGNSDNAPVIFTTNATERMRITSAGNVGIGTSAPALNLHVHSSADTALLLTNTTSGSDADSGLEIKVINSGAHAYINQQENADLIIRTNDTDRMRITAAGLVGIGTSSPSNVLTVSSATQYKGYTLTNGTNTIAELIGFAAGNDTGGLKLYSAGVAKAQVLAAGTSFFNGGNVGIGTTAPVNKLSIESTGGGSSEIDISLVSGISNKECILNFGKNLATADRYLGRIFYQVDNNVMGFWTNNTERMRIDSTGNVGIGKSTSAGKSLELYAASSTGLRVQNSATGTASSDGFLLEQSGLDTLLVNYEAGAMKFYTSNAERMRITSAGNVLVGTTSFALTAAGLEIGPSTINSGAAGTAALSRFVFGNGNGNVGQIYTDGVTTVYATSSDYRLKNDIAPMTGALAKVALLKPVTYKWNADGSAGQGFIAHELQEVIADGVYGEKDGVDAEGKPEYQSVDTSFLVATLTAAIQEQQTLITALSARITTLEG